MTTKTVCSKNKNDTTIESDTNIDKGIHYSDSDIIDETPQNIVIQKTPLGNSNGMSYLNAKKQSKSLHKKIVK